MNQIGILLRAVTAIKHFVPTTCPILTIRNIEMHLALQSVPFHGYHHLARIKRINVFVNHLHTGNVFGYGKLAYSLACSGIPDIINGEINGNISAFIQCFLVVGNVEQHGTKLVIIRVAHF